MNDEVGEPTHLDDARASIGEVARAVENHDWPRMPALTAVVQMHTLVSIAESLERIARALEARQLEGG